MKASELFIRSLENEGVEYIFGILGVQIEETEQPTPTLHDALSRDTVTIIDYPVGYRENLKLTETLGQLTSSN